MIKDSSGKFAKIRRMIDLLSSHSEGLTLKQISSRLNIDIRTVKRYLSEIRQAHYSVSDLREAANHPSLYYVRDNSEVPEHFLPLLRNLNKELISWGNPRFAGEIKQVIGYLESLNSKTKKTNWTSGELLKTVANVYHVDHGPFSERDVPVDRLRIMETAIVAHSVLQIKYSSYKAENAEFEFYPYGLCLRVGTLYLVGRVRSNRGLFKTLSVKRIARCQATSRHFKPVPFNMGTFYKYCFGQFARQPRESSEIVLLRIESPWLRKYLAESHFNPPGRLFKQDSDVFFELEVVIKPDFENWVLSHIPDLVPIKPLSLVKTIQQKMERGLGLIEPYRGLGLIEPYRGL